MLFGNLLIAAGVAVPALAYPSMANQASSKKSKGAKRQGFNAQAQLIDVSGSHAFVPPGHGDLRGPCPGLNALANHNYLPHDGLATIAEFIDATNTVFGMGIDLATFLSTYGAVIDGDGTSWSIGGAPASVGLAGLVPGLLSPPEGISNSHNKYESDASPTRGDLYEYGNDYLLQLSQFEALYATQSSAAEPNYNLDVLTAFRAQRFQESINNNPYFFNGPVSGIAVVPAAYTFIYRFMANHSAANPEGILGTDVLKSFFAITGDEGNFQYNAGYEQIPANWYRRAIGDEYTIPYYSVDLDEAALTHPQFLSVGGNTGTTNSFTGVDISNLTGGVYNTKSLLQGNNAACFGFQAAVLLAPDILKGLVSDVTGAVNQIAGSITGGLAQLGCPQLQAIDEAQLQQFPGYTKLNAQGSY